MIKRTINWTNDEKEVKVRKDSDEAVRPSDIKVEPIKKEKFGSRNVLNQRIVDKLVRK